MDEKLKRENMQKEKFSEWGWGERRYAGHIFIQIYFRTHHFVVKFFKFSSPQAQGGIDPLTKILRTLFLLDPTKGSGMRCKPPPPCGTGQSPRSPIANAFYDFLNPKVCSNNLPQMEVSKLVTWRYVSRQKVLNAGVGCILLIPPPLWTRHCVQTYVSQIPTLNLFKDKLKAHLLSGNK